MDGWSTYDESVLKLPKVSFWGKCARTGHPLKLPSLTKLPRLGHFPPASQAWRLDGPVFYVYVFSLVLTFSPYDGACLRKPGDELQLGRGIEGEDVDGHHHRHTELLRVLNLKR